MSRRSHSILLGEVARAGFIELAHSRDRVTTLAQQLDLDVQELLADFSHAADPDTALFSLEQLNNRHPAVLLALSTVARRRLLVLLGASPAFGAFFERNPERLSEILERGGRLVTEDEARLTLVDAVVTAVSVKPAAQGIEPAAALRIRYRELLAEVVLYDLLTAPEGAGSGHFTDVSRSLSNLSTGALEAALSIARSALSNGLHGAPVDSQRVAATRLSVIAMGKWGAQELNIVSDVDVMFIAEPVEAQNLVDGIAAQQIGTRIATEVIRAISGPAIEPALWEVDTGLRPEGRQGALVRSLASMLTYYERWARTWEFQALIKARAAAGDRELGEEFVAGTRKLVWASAQRDDFVASVQRMRERVTEHIDAERIESEIKLGPGGLRDIEFSVQLLQLVHGQHEPDLHLAGTLPALEALVDGGFIARSDGEQLAHDYRFLRTLEHRLQLRDLRRTALMPGEESARRALARSVGLNSADELEEQWNSTKREVRSLHLKIFYAPLLAAVAALPEGEAVLSGDEARARISSLGFRDPEGALRHLSALSAGTSRNARIQRNLLPVLLHWIAAGTDPDFGLLAFRRVSEANRDTPWYLRLLRDGATAAERLTRVLSTSHFAADLLEKIPEAVAWLERDDELQPTPLSSLSEEMRALVSRRESAIEVAPYLRAVHRREILRLALGRLTFVISDEQVAAGLDAVHTALLDSMLLALREEPELSVSNIEVALVAMGRYGGRELGFASDIDVLAVYRAETPATSATSDTSSTPATGADSDAQSPERAAEQIITQLRSLLNVPGGSVALDFDLRPEGKNGPIVRSLDAYRSYYERWSLTWEAQALLRARAVVGDEQLMADFELLADEIRYPKSFSDGATREVRRLKARVEAERLPRGVEPRRHLKLGPGGLSDVEWVAQLLQLRHASQESRLRTTSTLRALRGAEAAGLIGVNDVEQLEAAWQLASAIRSAALLWSGRSPDVLPTSREDLEGIARILGSQRGETTELEERWLHLSRRARAIFEREFFGFTAESNYLAPLD